MKSGLEFENHFKHLKIAYFLEKCKENILFLVSPGVKNDIESIVIKLCLPDVSRKKTDDREEFGEGILGEIDGVSTHAKIMLIVQSTEAQDGDEKTLNHILLKTGAHAREGLLINILKVPDPGEELAPPYWISNYN
ncbi:hypothetical protein AVEN_209886-1 [Araneus ventricosus]|uniref:Uncharacterized protein n=1 Tax=Araneus ventricosus TaxID=182803 RepID=A0A4Y2MDL2_ARAVE|nr:hypothetical protein AVEN_209886-1 [Araneus ventricosus]